VPGLIASIARRMCACKLDTSVGVSGPHDLAVREDAFVGAQRAEPPHVHHIPPPYVRDDRDTPLAQRRRDGERIIMDFGKMEEIFSTAGLT
jgi:hypothetical protein